VFLAEAAQGRTGAECGPVANRTVAQLCDSTLADPFGSPSSLPTTLTGLQGVWPEKTQKAFSGGQKAIGRDGILA